jgi:hypothetical protein
MMLAFEPHTSLCQSCVKKKNRPTGGKQRVRLLTVSFATTHPMQNAKNAKFHLLGNVTTSFNRFFRPSACCIG